MDFKNKVVLITGASRGIGRAVALAFANKNASVVINYKKNRVEAEHSFSLLKTGEHSCFEADISDSDALEKMIEMIIDKYGKIDVLINNAGVGNFHPIDMVSFDDWRKSWTTIINTNLIAVSNTCYLVARQMIKQGSGRIVNVSSRGAFRGEPLQPAYGASKAGLNALSQSLAKQLGKYNIFVNVVAPGFVETDMAAELLTPEEEAAIRQDSPLQRMARPEEVADAILFLASEQSAFTTGAILDINGASYLRT